MHDWGLPGIEEKWPETDEELKSWHNGKYYDLDCFGNNINGIIPRKLDVGSMHVHIKKAIFIYWFILFLFLLIL